MIEQKEMAERLMKDTTKADKDQLPNTGCDANWELNLSPVFVEIDTKQVRMRKTSPTLFLRVFYGNSMQYKHQELLCVVYEGTVRD